jgi:predicted aldo/keto reductase-like oxidoreductase
LHDLRDQDDLQEIFGKGGALEALVQARQEKCVRFLGLTGHHDPQILLDAMKRFSFDTLLVALNAADVHRESFINNVLPEARRQGLGVIAMKTCSQGALLESGVLNMDEALGYALSLEGVCHAIVGCKTTAEVDDNARIARQFKPFDAEHMRELEARTRAEHERYAYYKK